MDVGKFTALSAYVVRHTRAMQGQELQQAELLALSFLLLQYIIAKFLSKI